jgi:hypothetical protein
MILTYIGCVSTVYSEDARQLLRHGRYLSIVTHHHMVASIDHSTLMQKCGKVDSIGVPCMRMTSLLFDVALDIRSTGTSMQGA